MNQIISGDACPDKDWNGSDKMNSMESYGKKQPMDYPMKGQAKMDKMDYKEDQMNAHEGEKMKGKMDYQMKNNMDKHMSGKMKYKNKEDMSEYKHDGSKGKMQSHKRDEMKYGENYKMKKQMKYGENYEMKKQMKYGKDYKMKKHASKDMKGEMMYGKMAPKASNGMAKIAKKQPVFVKSHNYRNKKPASKMHPYSDKKMYPKSSQSPKTYVKLDAKAKQMKYAKKYELKKKYMEKKCCNSNYYARKKCCYKYPSCPCCKKYKKSAYKLGEEQKSGENKEMKY